MVCSQGEEVENTSSSSHSIKPSSFAGISFIGCWANIVTMGRLSSK